MREAISHLKGYSHNPQPSLGTISFQQKPTKVSTMSKIALTRLLLSGAIVGVALGNLFGVDLSAYLPTDLVTGVAGASVAAVAMKVVHIL